MNNRKLTPTEIAQEIARVVRKATGAKIEVTFRGEGELTVSGRPQDVATAKTVLPASLRLTGEVADDELGEVFAYYAEK